MVERKIGPDIFRILCCFGVIVYHTFDDILLFIPYDFTITIFVYFLASYCVTGFFILSGYLYGKKKTASFCYSANKILYTTTKYSFWLIVVRLFYSLFSANTLPVITDFWAGFMAGGTLPVAWFLFTYMVIMLFAPLLHILMKKNILIFSLATSVLFLITAFPNQINMLNKAQQFWFPLYTAYFMAGMLISNIPFNKISLKHRLLLASVCLFSFVFYLCKVYCYKYLIPPNFHYNRFYYIVWVISLFILICSIDFNWPILTDLVRILAKSTFTVYMLHLPILLMFTAYYPLHGIIFTAIVTVSLFLICERIGIMLYKIPILKFFA